jgi:hypothetical protein
MKKQSPFLIRNPIFLLFLLLIGSSVSTAAGPGDAEKSFGIFINGKRLPIEADSLAINAKGTLTLHALGGELPNGEQVRFKVWIFHRMYAGKTLLFPWKEEYKNGEPRDTVDLSKILLKTKAGDQLIVIPENSNDQFQITVRGNNC